VSAPQRRGWGAAPDVKPLLRVARPQLDAEIAERLELGQKLLDRRPYNDEQMYLERCAYESWDEVNEIPSDIMGVLYKPLSGNWHTELAKELRAAGIDIDPGKLF
jgi:hypothetical protein